MPALGWLAVTYASGGQCCQLAAEVWVSAESACISEISAWTPVCSPADDAAPAHLRLASLPECLGGAALSAATASVHMLDGVLHCVAAHCSSMHTSQLQAASSERASVEGSARGGSHALPERPVLP